MHGNRMPDASCLMDRCIMQGMGQIGIASAIAFLVTVGCAAPVAGSEGQSPKLNPGAERLIDQLVQFGKATTGAHPTAWSSQFMAIDEEPEFHGGILGSAKPTVDPTMRKLVQMGVAALPSLIAHLSDARETKLVENHGQGFGGMWFSDEYTPRYDDPKRLPKGVDSKGDGFGKEEDVPGQKYTIKVGDLCFVAIGQIVNRGFSALRYQPTACEVINSPVHTPALAAAVKADWGGLTEADHKAQLEEDAYELWPWSASEATKRMLYYYPEDGERLALKLLNRDLYDHLDVWNAADAMMKVDDPGRWKQLYEKAVAEFGPKAAATIPHWVHWSNWETSTEHPKAMQDRANRLFRALFPDYSPYKHPFYGVEDVDDQVTLVRALKAFPNAKIDAAVHSLFVRALGRPKSKDTNEDFVWQRQRYLDELAVASADRLAGKEYDAFYLEYFKKRLTQIWSEYKGQEYNRSYWRDEFNGAIKKLSRKA